MPENIQTVCWDYRCNGRYPIHYQIYFHIQRRPESNLTILNVSRFFPAYTFMLQFQSMPLEEKTSLQKTWVILLDSVFQDFQYTIYSGYDGTRGQSTTCRKWQQSLWKRHLRSASKPLVWTRQAAKLCIFRCQSRCNEQSWKTRCLWTGYPPEPTVWEVCQVCATGLLWKKIWYCAKLLYHNFCSYSWSCSLQLELCLSGSSPPALGRPHGIDTLLRPSSPRVGLLLADPQEKRNVLPEKRSVEIKHFLKKSKITRYLNYLHYCDLYFKFFLNCSITWSFAITINIIWKNPWKYLCCQVDIIKRLKVCG